MRACPRRLADGVLCVIWAPRCAACDVLLERPTQGVVCPACWRRVERITPPLCNCSGRPQPVAPAAGAAEGGCPACAPRRNGDNPLDRRRAAGWYRGALRSVIHAFKYQGRRSLAEPLAALMRAAGQPLLAAADVVVPVPLHPRRRWQRGFNQARDLAVRLGPPVADILRRTRHTQPQTTLAAGRRGSNVRGAFELSGGGWFGAGYPVAGRTVVVADDVMTTGATLEACARVLCAAGARAVFGLTAARVLHRQRPRSPRQHRGATARRPLAASRAAPPAAGSFP